jgi:hypothetical protein
MAYDEYSQLFVDRDNTNIAAAESFRKNPGPWRVSYYPAHIVLSVYHDSGNIPGAAATFVYRFNRLDDVVAMHVMGLL